MQKDLKAIFGQHTGLDNKSIQFLTDALSKNNLPGFDYLEFKQSLNVLAGMEMDEPTAMKSAFATASTMGLTKEKLVKTAHHYLEVLDKEKNQFDQALQRQMQQKVASKREEVEKLKKKIQEYKQKILELEERIRSSQNTVDTADEKIQAAVDKIDQTRENFEQTFQSIKNQINVDIENIQNYL
jgi:chromosome segregation ATPase